MNLHPDAVPLPDHEIVVAYPPGWKIVREHPPRTPAANQIKDRIDNLALWVARRPAALLGFRNQPFQHFPLPVCKITRIDLLAYHRDLIAKMVKFVQLKMLIARIFSTF